jgi:hypothetical protein
MARDYNLSRYFDEHPDDTLVEVRLYTKDESYVKRYPIYGPIQPEAMIESIKEALLKKLEEV